MLNACLIPSYGAVGASMATVAAEAIEFIVMSKYITRYMKLSFVFENTHHYLIAVAPGTRGRFFCPGWAVILAGKWDKRTVPLSHKCSVSRAIRKIARFLLTGPNRSDITIIVKT